MPKFFISYRRDDSRIESWAIYDLLSKYYGKRNVFIDVAGIKAGRDFRSQITEAINQCDLIVVMIGKNWEGRTDQGLRISSPDDFVRIEVEAALKKDGSPILPILVSDRKMPTAEGLPECIQPITFQHALEFRPQLDFERDKQRILKEIKERFPPGIWQRWRGVAVKTMISTALIAVLAISMVLIFLTSQNNEPKFTP
ncbi:MAG: toll/interleukin-1 receptor domain-containing protein, partial [Verrucomicrobiales bacterium]|nr:toll/interleukin-1 receptor domain-containing protein [Verrucomicrobiales bacterium]